MKFWLGWIALTACAVVIGVTTVLGSAMRTVDQAPKPLVLQKGWTPRQAWDLVGDLRPDSSMTIPFKGRQFECVVFGDESLQYGHPKAVLQACFDRKTLARLVHEDGLDKKGPVG